MKQIIIVLLIGSSLGAMRPAVLRDIKNAPQRQKSQSLRKTLLTSKFITAYNRHQAAEQAVASQKKMKKALYKAIKRSDVTGITELVKQGVDITGIIGGTDTALVAAMKIDKEEDRVPFVHYLLWFQAPIDAVDKQGLTALHYAALKGHAEALCVLLEAGATVNLSKYSGETALTLAALNGHATCVEALLAAGADPNKGKLNGQTPLSGAALKGHAACVRLLLEAGASPNKAHLDGSTPLHLACITGHIDCVELLLFFNADPMSCKKDGQTPLHLAALQGNDLCCEMLLICGADVNAKDSKGETPLELAALQGNKETVCLFLVSGAGVNERNNLHQTALSAAALRGNYIIAKMLLERGASVDGKDTRFGSTPLHCAYQKGHKKLATLLLKAGANPSALNKAGRRPIDLLKE